MKLSEEAKTETQVKGQDSKSHQLQPEAVDNCINHTRDAHAVYMSSSCHVKRSNRKQIKLQ